MTDQPKKNAQIKKIVNEQEGSLSFFGSCVSIITRHKNLANFLMIIMIIIGVYGLYNIDTRFFPKFKLDIISVSISWPGAGAEDVDLNIVEPVQTKLRFLDGVNNIKAKAKEGGASFVIEFQNGWDISRASEDVKSSLNQLLTLPEDSKRPVVQRLAPLEPVGSLLLYGTVSEKELQQYALKVRDDLLDLGLEKVNLLGMRDEEIWVEVKTHKLQRYALTTKDIAVAIRNTALDMPGGVSRGMNEQQIRTKGIIKSAQEVEEIEIRSKNSGERLIVKNIANVKETFDIDQPTRWKDAERQAIKISILHSGDNSSVQDLKKMRNYTKNVQDDLPPNIVLEIASEEAKLILERMDVMLKNGVTGMVLVVLVLFLFLNFRIALWVSLGIPLAILLTLGLMSYLDYSLNMVSMFAFIMTLGVIVDDAIVVGEHASKLHESDGLRADNAAIQGVLQMSSPIFASALTTVVAFIPVFLVDGSFGAIVKPIPLTVILVLIASLLECYFILPAHMYYALLKSSTDKKMKHNKLIAYLIKFRSLFQERFEKIRQTKCPKITGWAFDNRYLMICISVAIIIVILGLMAGGRVGFRFFPEPEAEHLVANITYQPGTPRHIVKEGVEIVRNSLFETDRKLRSEGQSLIKTYSHQLGSVGGTEGSVFLNTGRNRSGNHLASVFVTLVQSENRSIRTQEFLDTWEDNIPEIFNIERISVINAVGSPGGTPIEFKLHGNSLSNLKQAAIELKNIISSYPGVVAPEDNLSYGKYELVLTVNEQGRALGFSNKSVGQQLRDSFEGIVAQRFTRENSEVAVRVVLLRDLFEEQSLDNFYLQIPNIRPVRYVSLKDVVTVKEKSGFTAIRRSGGDREVEVKAGFIVGYGNPENVMSDVRQKFLPGLVKKYNVSYETGAQSQETQGVLKTLSWGLMISLALIYIILAIIFSNYVLPLIVMAIVPFGLFGGILGHFVQGFDLNFLSLMALLGLSGILINNSIILMIRIQEQQAQGVELRTAVIQATKDRFRPVVLTSVTTIFGLLPLLFETNAQALFLIPIAITMAWGLALSSLLVLLLIPAILGIVEDLQKRR